MSVEVNNESSMTVDENGLARLAEFVLAELRVNPRAQLSVLMVDEDTMTAYHRQWMDEDGSTDVLSFPMDELRPGDDVDDEHTEVVLGDVVLCPQVTQRQAAEHGRSTESENEYLLTHGILHLLGFDHATPVERAEMFGLKDKLLAAWDEAR